MIDPKHKLRFWSLIVILVIVMMAGVLMGANTNNQRGVADLAYMTTSQFPTSGNYFYVDNGSSYAQDSHPRNGGSWDRPFNTIDFAFTHATANNGDIVFVAQGHAENISTASYIDMDVAGVRLISMGFARDRSTLTWTAAAAYIEINAANVSIENFILDMSTTGIAATGVSLYSNATDFKFLNNEVILYEIASGSGAATAAITTVSGGTRMVVANSRFIGDKNSLSGVSEVIAISVGGVNDVHIIDSYFSAYSSTFLINLSTSSVSGFLLENVDMHQNKAAGSGNFSASSAQGLMRNVSTGYIAGVTLTTSALANVNDF